MFPKDPKEYLWRRIVALLGLGEGAGVDAVFAKLQGSGVSRGTIQRIKEGETSTGTDNLVKLAAHFKLEVWQLLAPEDAAAKPGKAARSHASPPPPPPRDFADQYEVSPEQWQLLQDIRMVLTKDEIQAIQVKAQAALQAAKEHIERQAAAAKSIKERK